MSVAIYLGKYRYLDVSFLERNSYGEKMNINNNKMFKLLNKNIWHANMIKYRCTDLVTKFCETTCYIFGIGILNILRF